MTQSQHLTQHMKQHEKDQAQCKLCFRFYGKNNEANHSCVKPVKKPRKGKAGMDKLTKTTNSAMVILIEEDAIKQVRDFNTLNATGKFLCSSWDAAN